MAARKIKNLNSIETFKTAFYLRISVEDENRERESNSISNQRLLLQNYIKDKEEFVFADEYVDEGVSGTSFDRPGFQKLLMDIEAGKISCVLCKDLSRFGRSHVATEWYIRYAFKEHGVRFISVLDNYDSLHESYDMLFTIKNVFNENYAQDISKKCQAAFKAKQKAGAFVGAFCSYGFRKSSVDKHVLEIDTYAAGVVQRIFDLYLQGYGQIKIAKILNEEGILCPAEYKKSNGENYHNSNKLDSTSYWTYSTIHTILKNEMLTGTMVQGKTAQEMNSKAYALDESEWIKVKNTHPAIIDQDTFDKVQDLLKRKKSNMNFEQNQSIFAGYLKCGDCGRAMVKKSYKTKSGETYYVFDCGSYVRTGNNVCTTRRIKESVLKDIVLSDLNEIIAQISNLRELAQKACEKVESYNATNRFYELEVERIQKSLERVKKLKQKCFENYSLELISMDEYTDYREQYLNEEKLLREKLKSLNSANEKKGQVDMLESPWVNHLLQYKQVQELTRNMILEMIDVIYIYKDKITIRYKFSSEYEYLLKTSYSFKE